LPSAFFQPRRFQFGIHFVTELMTYWLSHRMCSGVSASAVALRISMTACSSPRLFVAFFQPPAAQQSSSMY